MSENKKKNPVRRTLSSAGRFLKRLFASRKAKLSVLEEEAARTPFKTVINNFSRRKLGMFGLIGFIAIFLFSFVGSLFVNGDLNYFELTEANLPPGYNYLNYPKELKGNGLDIVKIVSGNSFSAALTKDGKVYMWGTEPNRKLRKVSDYVLDIPKEVQNAFIVDIEAGTKHMIAIDNFGNFYGWGYYSNEQTTLPNPMLESWVERINNGQERIVQMQASQMWSAVLTDQGNFYIWGGIQALSQIVVPSELNGHIKKIATGDVCITLLLDDGTIRVFGEAGSEYLTTVPPELMDGSVHVVDVVSGNRNALALDDQGNLYLWGSGLYGVMDVPEISGRPVKLEGNYKNFAVITEDGSMFVWGANELNQLKVPGINEKIVNVFGDYSKFYAIGESGKIYAWGNRGFLFGTDEKGRDVFTRVILGGRISLTVGAIAVVIEIILALIIGMAAGFYGGWLDMMLMRLADIVMSLPFTAIAITLAAVLGSKVAPMDRMYLIMVILGILGWPDLARLVRAQILLEREKDFVLSAKALGIKENVIMRRHILPNVFNLVIVNITLGYASAMLTEAGLSFLGYGVTEPQPSWGNMLESAKRMTVIQYHWWRWIIPGLFVIFAALCMNLIGDALREAMDPRSNER